MINILMPMAGKSKFFDIPGYPFPIPLIEIEGNPMIELVINNFNSIEKKKKFIFVVNGDECNKYRLDNVLKLLTDDRCEIIKLSGETKGAACSALMAIEHINNDEELIIANSDQVIEEDLDRILNIFRKKNADAAVICFESVHPRWSYVQLDKNNRIVEAAEKRPISKNAIAGMYYFKHGKYFIEAAMESIRKDASVDGLYYIAPTLNELVLKSKKLEIYRIENEKYHTFYLPQKIEDYEKRTQR